MPWCDSCSRYWAGDAVPPDRSCPSCGRALPEPVIGESEGAPWHFKLLMVAVVAYLAWRAVPLVEWLVARV